jgi:fructose-1,6-bisphosphatase II / sedoheptulose-1,7-bisphosphatase
MLYIGEHVGTGSGPNVDVALDPLEGTDICANGGSNALAVVAIAEKGGFLNAPDVYMEKLAVGAGFPPDILDIEASPKQNIHNIAKAKKCDASEISAVILERPRHKELIAKVRETGARITLIDDGDVAGIIATTRWETGADVYMGIGGAPEGVLAAAALRSTGGQMQGRLIFEGDKIDASQKERAKRMGISDFNKIYTTEELATGDVMFSATGVTNGWMLSGVTKIKDKAYTETLVMRSRTKTIRRIKTEHNLNFKPI